MPETANNFNHNQPIYTVSEVAGAIKRTVEDRFGVVRIRGEISGFKLASSGHAYYRLKDSDAVIDAVSWRGQLGKLSFKPEDGLEVVATGKITTYPGKSSYQIVVEHLEPAGAGALMALLEKRKKQLEAEGLFEAARKKTIPYLPRVIGVVTSPTGAVIRDILHRIEERFPVHVLVWPVAVQGEEAAAQIASAINGFNQALSDFASHILPPDVIIVARGGGSLEDLWAFNEEIVVRAAAASRIPLISAVGHETDTTLIDFASDKRAPTPTAAAEMAVPVRAELLVMLRQLDVRLLQAARRLFDERRERLEGLSRGLPKPDQLLQIATQKLDDWAERLRAALPAQLMQKNQKLLVLSAMLKPALLQKEIAQQSKNIDVYYERLQRHLTQMLARLQNALVSEIRLLENVSVERVLERGFVLVRDDNNRLITHVADAKTKTKLILRFMDGEITVARN